MRRCAADSSLASTTVDAVTDTASATSTTNGTADADADRRIGRPGNQIPNPEYRTYDGTKNNAANWSWGSAGVQLLRKASPAYSDGVSSLAGASRPSPRLISNTIADQGDQDIISDRLLSAMIYAWGQFIDHDLDLTPTGGTEIIAVPVPAGDPYFDPSNTGMEAIYTSRSIFDPTTGTSVSNLRQQVTSITGFLDASMVYSSDTTTAMKLRTLSGGLLKSSPGGFLPVNNTVYFPTGNLQMANDAHVVETDQLFAAGDVRERKRRVALAPDSVPPGAQRPRVQNRLGYAHAHR